MPRKKSTAQRSLLVDWPTWHQLPTEVRQHVEHLVASMCLEVIQSNNSRVLSASVYECFRGVGYDWLSKQ